MGYKSNTVDIVRISTESELYEIFSTTNVISKYLIGSIQSYALEFSPPEVQIEFYEKKQAQLINNLDFNFKILEKNKESIFNLTELQEQYNKIKIELQLIEEFTEFFIVDNTALKIKIQDFYTFISELKKILTQTIIDDTPYIWTLIDILASDSGIIKIQWFIDNQLTTEGVLIINYGLSTEAAKFNINANSINASVGKGLLEFTSNGLHLHNGGLIITAKTSENIEKTVFKIDGDDTVGYNLILEGNGNFTGNIYADGGYFKGELQAATGSFKGELQAATGSFTGEISALSGNIGGFTIEKEQLSSNFITEYLPYKVNSNDNPQALKLYEKINNSSDYKLTSDEIPETGKEYYIGKPSIELKGIEGKIIANSIELGTNAVIQDYIALGKARLYNPDLPKHKELILEAGNVKLDQNGNLTLGNLQYDNKNDILKGNNWSINPDKAIFNNVDVTGTIHTSVFEIGEIQAVGGGMIFSPASKFEVNSDNSIKLSSNMTLKQDDVVLLTNNNGDKTEAIVKIETNGQIYFKKLSDNSNFSIDDLKKYDTIIFLNNSGQELLIGVNSSSSENWKLKPQGFSFIVPKKKENSVYYTEYNKPVLFLGNLNSLGISNVSGYGLYGENVYLKGSLTTEVSSIEETTYAGINTINGIKFNPALIDAPDTLKEDNSNIVFWAGAKSNEITDIQEAKFQVTAQGTIYAQQGYFADSVIVGATIAGNTDISVPAIYGSGNNPSLKLSDVYTGISFISRINTTEFEIFNIKENAFAFNLSTREATPIWRDFITFDHIKDVVTFIGSQVELTKSLKLDNFEIIKDSNQYVLRTLQSNTDTIQIENQILYESNGLKLEHSATNTDISIENQNIRLNANDVFIPTILSLGDKVNIEKVIGGFNINIQE